jgi:hypothetical protein
MTTAIKIDKRNRKDTADRPRKAKDLRESLLFVGHQCREAGGHDHVFARGDNYGCCTRCGDEVLT